jgi:hypothetical protein
MGRLNYRRRQGERWRLRVDLNRGWDQGDHGRRGYNRQLRRGGDAIRQSVRGRGHVNQLNAEFILILWAQSKPPG